MRKFLFIQIFLLSICFFNAQKIVFDKGYYINNADEKIECFIQNIDWRINPTEIQFKMNLEDDLKTETIKNIKEFSIYNQVKFIRQLVEIDRSESRIQNLSKNPLPEFSKEELFLKVLVEGKADLYSYTENNLKKFFFNIDQNNITQLVFKVYENSQQSNIINRNDQYKQQLFLALKCEKISENRLMNLDYKESELKDIFLDYNSYNNSNNVTFKEKNGGKLININFKPRINFTSANVKSLFEELNAEFSTKTNFSFAAEVEAVLPIMKNRWSLFTEFIYQKYSSNFSKSTDYIVGGLIKSDINYQSIEVPIGVRHYVPLTKNLLLSFDISLYISFANKSEIIYSRKDDSKYAMYELEKTSSNLATGLGLSYNRFSIQYRLLFDKNVNYNTSNTEFNINSNSLILGYRIF